jgi:hypothetical protein
MIPGKALIQNFKGGAKIIITPDEGIRFIDCARINSEQVVIIPLEEYKSYYENPNTSSNTSPEVKEKIKVIYALLDDLRAELENPL